MQTTTIAPGHQLAVPAALAYLRARGAGAPSGIRSARRDPAEQIELFRDRYRPRDTEDGNGPYGDVRWWGGVRYVRISPLGAVAIPGSSEHETGLALDVDEPARSWFHLYGRPFGWIPFRVAGEPWHLEYIEAEDTTRGDQDMLIIRRKTDKGYTYRLVVPGHPTIAITQPAAAAIKKAGVKLAHLSTADYLRLIRGMK